jgi:hypothetical protein
LCSLLNSSHSSTTGYRNPKLYDDAFTNQESQSDLYDYASTNKNSRPNLDETASTNQHSPSNLYDNASSNKNDRLKLGETSSTNQNSQHNPYDNAFNEYESQQAFEEDRGGKLEDEDELEGEDDENAKSKQLFGLGSYPFHHHFPFGAGYLDPSQLYQQYIPEIDMQVKGKYRGHYTH